jgi:hypothetical protein
MTEKVSAEIVEQTWQRVAQTPPSDASVLVNQMGKEQPYLMTYLLATADAGFEPHEGEILFYVGMVTWQMMTQSSGQLQQVGGKALDEAEAANFEFLEQFAKEESGGLEIATRVILETYPEPEVFRYVVEAIMEEEETDEPPMSDESRGLAFVYLKTVLDAMIASLAHPHRSH